MLGTSQQVFAASCTVNTGSYTVNVPDIIVQRDTPVGSAISNVIYGTSSLAYTCTASQYEGSSAGVKSGILSYYGNTTDGYRIYKTNITGVGVTVGVKSSTHNTGGSADGYHEYIIGGPQATSNGAHGDDWNMQGWSSNPGNIMTYTFQPRVQFYKIGTIESATLTGQYASFIANSSSKAAGGWAPEIPISFGSGKITQVACSIKTPTLTFPIGNVNASTFGSSVGFTPTQTNTQNLGLDCDAGANINVSLNGTQNPDVTETSVLALDSPEGENVATGVGVQLLYNDTPLKINDNIVLKQSAGDQETFPITARYYQTRTSVTAGSANASATLTLTYQ